MISYLRSSIFLTADKGKFYRFLPLSQSQFLFLMIDIKAPNRKFLKRSHLVNAKFLSFLTLCFFCFFCFLVWGNLLFLELLYLDTWINYTVYFLYLNDSHLSANVVFPTCYCYVEDLFKECSRFHPLFFNNLGLFISLSLVIGNVVLR